MTAVIGGIGTFAAWIAVTVLHTEAKIVGIPWMVDRDGRLLLLPQTPGARPAEELQDRTCAERPADFEELEYKTALVPIFGDDVSASALHSAAKLIGEEGVVYAIYVLPVPSQLSLEAGLEEEEAQGRSVLESARIQARRLGHQDPHRPDPHAQPRSGARRGSRTRGLRRHLLVDDPRARR